MGKVLAINISPVRGVEKSSVTEVEVVPGWGLAGDAHGGDWDRQVSILPVEAMSQVPPGKIEEVQRGGYTENFTISGIEPDRLTVGSFIIIGTAVIRILHIGKEEYKEHGRPYLVSRQGRFGRVARGGRVSVGDAVSVVKYDRDSFLQCARDGQADMVQLFLDTGMNPEVKNKYDATALILAAKGNQIPVARVLLQSGADVNTSSDDGITALMVAAYGGDVDLVKMLLDAGADVHMQSSSGLTALKLAQTENRAAVVQLLKQAGA